jgi:hypothetical protein
MDVSGQYKNKAELHLQLFILNVILKLFSYGVFHFRRLGGVVVSVLATGPKDCGFKTRPRRWIFKGNKNPQHTFLSDGK